MDIKNTVELSNLLTILRAHGVAAFSTGTVSIAFATEDDNELVLEDDETEVDWQGVQVFE